MWLTKGALSSGSPYQIERLVVSCIGAQHANKNWIALLVGHLDEVVEK
jgi:hypothetical protein